MMKWTDTQSEAIQLRDKNIIVSAAAGSGKTAVLVERIKQLILKDHVSIDQMLVATFTNAAASDMKEKIVKVIQKEIVDNPKDSLFLKNQLNMIYKANINTFHSFALEVIRRYFHLIGVDPNFKICDDAEKTILQAEAMDDLFEEAFNSGDESFILFLKQYATAKSEKNAKEMILSVHQMIKTLLEPIKWLECSVNRLSSQTDELMEFLLPFIMEETSGSLKNAIGAFLRTREMLLENGVLSLAAKCEKDIAAVTQIAKIIDEKKYEEAISCVKTITYERFSVSKEEKAVFEDIKDAVTKIRDKGKESIKECKEKYFTRSFEEEACDVRSTHENASVLVKLVKRFDELYNERKREKNLIDFSDAEHYTLEVLKDEKAAGEYQHKFKYIFVDEYQDSNLLQETLISRIKRANNVFMVGDVKQSIYKFRLAEPELFIRKYEIFKSSVTGYDAKIDLNTNFRCKGHIIGTVNLICENIMPYDENAALHKGVAYEGDLDYPVELHLVETKEIEDEQIDSEINEMKKAELEANIAAKLIKNAVGTEIYEEGKDGAGSVRKLELRDIVILMRAVRNYGDKYYQVLTEKGIPAYMDDSDGFFDTLEIEVFLNLLRVIDNKRQDVPLISALHSKTMGFTLEELATIRIACKDTSYFNAFEKYAKEGADDALRCKCAEAFEKIEAWKRLSLVAGLDDLLWKIMWDTGYYLYIGALPGGQQRQANLRALIDKALTYTQTRSDGLFGFIKYIDIVKKKGVQIGQVSLAGENDNVVRLKTIHKSKGLEYPMVIVAGLGKRFMAGRDNGQVSVHKDVGLGLPFVIPEEKLRRKTLIQNVIEKKIKNEELDEEARVLYVALTRAKDRLFLLGSVADAEKAIEQYRSLDPGNRKMTNCYLDMIAPTMIRKRMPYTIHTRSDVSLAAAKSDLFQKEFKAMLLQKGSLSTDTEIRRVIENRMAYEYENKKALTAKSKYTVSELARLDAQQNYEKPLPMPIFMQGKKKLSGAEIGTAMHKVMEKMNFKEAAGAFAESREAGYSYLAGLLEELKEKVILTPEEADAVNLKRFEAFLLSDLGQRTARAEKLYKESAFNLIMEVGGIKTIVQGIIDCYFEEDGKVVLLDYKTNATAKQEESIERLKEMYGAQIEIYSQALASIRYVEVKERYLYLFGIDQAIKV